MLSLLFLLGLISLSNAQSDPYVQISELLIDQAMKSSNIENLEYMCDTFGPRLSGTPPLEQAIDWVLSTMTAQGMNQREREKERNREERQKEKEKREMIVTVHVYQIRIGKCER